MCICINTQLSLVLNANADINDNSTNHEDWVIIYTWYDKTIMKVIEAARKLVSKSYLKFSRKFENKGINNQSK
jgi:hypothetical protein